MTQKHSSGNLSPGMAEDQGIDAAMQAGTRPRCHSRIGGIPDSALNNFCHVWDRCRGGSILPAPFAPNGQRLAVSGGSLGNSQGMAPGSSRCTSHTRKDGFTLAILFVEIARRATK